MTTGQWLASGDDTRWFFDSGALSLDFRYTGAEGDTAGWEQLASPADLLSWLSPRARQLDPAVSERDLADALLLRAAIARAVAAVNARATIPADDIDTINLYAAMPDIPPALEGGRRRAGAGRMRVGQALSTIARDTVTLLGDREPERIRDCSADDCGLIFYDESRANNRRWCSMQRCGNRAKVRAHRARRAE